MSFFSLIKKNDPSFKKNLGFFFLAYFLVLFNYPLIRASTTSLFFEAYGAKSSPAAWAWAVVFLSVSIFICNRLQKSRNVQKVFMFASLFSALIFFGGNLSHLQENKIFAYLSFIWKEICIVIQVHLLLGYANNYFKKEDFKYLVGPVGAIGSLGGILGGLLTSYLSTHYGTRAVLDVGVLFVLLPFFSFLGTQNIQSVQEQKNSPVSSLNTPELRRYVLLICGMVASAQFIINIADFKFNLAFEKVIPTSDLRTAYLGDIYTWTNALTFLFQFLILPFLLPRLSEKKLHLFIPLSYMLCLLLMNLGGHIGLWPIAGLYVYFKAADYSFFSAGKELLYQPLASAQKYGAKYLTDMLVYRASKASIAVLLIYLQSSFILDMMMGAFLLIWLLIVVKLFGLHQKLFN
jgi:AAA family ATP:ADP antiporter